MCQCSSLIAASCGFLVEQLEGFFDIGQLTLWKSILIFDLHSGRPDCPSDAVDLSIIYLIWLMVFSLKLMRYLMALYSKIYIPMIRNQSL